VKLTFSGDSEGLLLCDEKVEELPDGEDIDILDERNGSDN